MCTSPAARPAAVPPRAAAVILARRSPRLVRLCGQPHEGSAPRGPGRARSSGPCAGTRRRWPRRPASMTREAPRAQPVNSIRWSRRTLAGTCRADASLFPLSVQREPTAPSARGLVGVAPPIRGTPRLPPHLRTRILPLCARHRSGDVEAGQQSRRPPERHTVPPFRRALR